MKFLIICVNPLPFERIHLELRPINEFSSLVGFISLFIARFVLTCEPNLDTFYWVSSYKLNATYMTALRISLISMLAIFSFSAQSQDVTSLIQTYLNENRETLQLSESDISDWKITDQHTSKQSALIHVYIQQTFDGVGIYSSSATFVIHEGVVKLTGNRLISDVSNKIDENVQSIDAEEAIYAAAKELNLNLPIRFIKSDKKSNGAVVFEVRELSQEPIPVRLAYAFDGEKLRLSWNLHIYELSGDHWWNVHVDATNGKLLEKVDWVVSCNFSHEHSAETCANVSHVNLAENQDYMRFAPPPPSTDQYNVFALPVESPNHGARSLEVGVSDLVASPFGWHDDNGLAGEEYTITRGNNVHAMEDQNDNNGIGYSPDGTAAINFDFPLDITQPTNTYLDAAITNLFYMNNMMHDIWYHYGFDEASGNFQQNNYGNGGLGSDYVNADAQDGGGTNNANFATPVDGSNPRMQMYLWSPSASSDLLTVNTPSGLSGPYTALEANFGPGVPSTPITADLALPNDGTPDIYDLCTDPTDPNILTGKIALIMRGTCQFNQKVQRAQDFGAVAVIVVNNVAGAPIAMGGTSVTINIPSVMISNADGLALIAAIEGGATINATLVSAGSVALDGDFDNGIIAHEYGHGISTRLTGGPGNSDCLSNAEQMGEGWSDWFGMMLTMETGDTGADVRGMGTFANGEPTTGNGIRPAPYSTSFSVNNYTYGATNNTSLSQPHGIGFVWATMLWDLNWALVDEYGFDPDFHYGTGGNNIAMALVIEALKLQPCSPGFVDGRDAILEADQLLYSGANECLIWDVFANRGLGFSADQGSSDSRTDQVQAFDLPPGLDPTTTVTTCGSYVWAQNGQTYTTSGTYTDAISGSACGTVATLNLTIVNNINSNVVQNNFVLTASQPNMNYQWVDCNADFAPIVGATNQSYVATQDGSYAVIVSLGECSDTSICFTFDSSSLEENDFGAALVVYPNPTDGSFFVDLGTVEDAIDVVLHDMNGRVVLRQSHVGAQQLEIRIDGAPGTYFLAIESKDGRKALVKIEKV